MLFFQIHGEFALWRNWTDVQTKTSSAGPSPSHLSGIFGAALGIRNKGRTPKMGKWPVAKELLNWQNENEIKVTIRILTLPRWDTANVNGFKSGFLSQDKAENLQISQTVLKNCAWEIGVEGKETALQQLECALNQPTFPIYLGSSQFRGQLKDIHLEEPKDNNWAFQTTQPEGYYAPLTQHLLKPNDLEEVIHFDGYITFPTPESKKSITLFSTTT